jgi:hypothetical protein
VRKEQILDLTGRVRDLIGTEVPVIVGSQSLYGVTDAVPESVRRSIECDFLILTGGPNAFKTVSQEIGLFSPFQRQTGYHADPVGLATVVLPTGWQERLVPLTDKTGKLHAHCLEVHDTCVSKLLAGRDKDFAFIKELLDRNLAEMGTFVIRAELVKEMPQSNALLPRLEKLEAFLSQARPSHDLAPLQQLIKRLRLPQE